MNKANEHGFGGYSTGAVLIHKLYFCLERGTDKVPLFALLFYNKYLYIFLYILKHLSMRVI